jgi:hypothetical protein
MPDRSVVDRIDPARSQTRFQCTALARSARPISSLRMGRVRIVLCAPGQPPAMIIFGQRRRRRRWLQHQTCSRCPAGISSAPCTALQRAERAHSRPRLLSTLERCGNSRALRRLGSGRCSRGAFGQALHFTDCVALAFTFGRSVLTEFSPSRAVARDQRGGSVSGQRTTLARPARLRS